MKAFINITGQPIGNVLIKTTLEHRNGVIKTESISNGFRIHFNTVGAAKKAMKSVYNELKEIDPETSYLEYVGDTLKYDSTNATMFKN